MDYSKALEFIMQIPMFQNRGKSAYNPSLEKIERLCGLLGNPQNSFKSLHIAGTNGKGSASNLLYEVLRCSGYKTALYTSPHLSDFRERAQIDGQLITKEFIGKFIGDNMALLVEEKPSFFELTTLLAFCWFAQSKVDVAIIETGLGGRLDATNIILPMVSIITNVSKDHADILGATLAEIATEKSGIIKRQIPTVIGEVGTEAAKIIEQRCKKMEAKALFAPEKYKFIEEHSPNGVRSLRYCSKNGTLEVKTNLLGLYQRENIATTLTAIDVLVSEYGFAIDSDNINRGFCSTTLRGRWQKLSESPLTVCDTGHNEAGIRSVVEQLSRCDYKTLYFVLAMVADKDIDHILPLLPTEATYIFTKSKVFRALDEKELQKKAQGFGLRGQSAPTVALALELARKLATKEDMIFVGGSTFTVAEILE